MPSDRRWRRQLSDDAATYVRDLITSGTLRSGEPVGPDQIAEQLQMSPTPVREALHALRAEGFLEPSSGRGFTVAPLTGADIRDIFVAQALVAGELAARAACNASDATLEDLAAIHAELHAAAASGDLVALEEHNHRFHRNVNRASAAPRLVWVVGLLARYVPRRFYASIDGWPQTTVEDHEGLLRSLCARDPERAKSVMEDHIRRAGDRLADHVDARLAGTGQPVPRQDGSPQTLAALLRTGGVRWEG